MEKDCLKIVELRFRENSISIAAKPQKPAGLLLKKQLAIF